METCSPPRGGFPHLSPTSSFTAASPISMRNHVSSAVTTVHGPTRCSRPRSIGFRALTPFFARKPSILDTLGTPEPFDPRFFLYNEEGDLCRPIEAAGYAVWYWPKIVLVHIDGDSSRQLRSLQMSSAGAQLTLWRMRSTLLECRKHHGLSSLGSRFLEVAWSYFRALRRSRSRDLRRRNEAKYFRAPAELMKQAWRETRGGRTSPPQPW